MKRAVIKPRKLLIDAAAEDRGLAHGNAGDCARSRMHSARMCEEGHMSNQLPCRSEANTTPPVPPASAANVTTLGPATSDKVSVNNPAIPISHARVPGCSAQDERGQQETGSAIRRWAARQAICDYFTLQNSVLAMSDVKRSKSAHGPTKAAAASRARCGRLPALRGYLHLRSLFVSGMSGDSSQPAAALGQGNPGDSGAIA